MKPLTQAERIKLLMKEFGYPTINKFSNSLGIPRTDRVYGYINDKREITKDFANIVKKKFPNISVAWIMTGEGNMFVLDEVESTKLEDMYKRVLDLEAENKRYKAIIDVILKEKGRL